MQIELCSFSRSFALFNDNIFISESLTPAWTYLLFINNYRVTELEDHLIWKIQKLRVQRKLTCMITQPVNGTVVVQSLSHVWLFATPCTAACQVSLSFTISWIVKEFAPNSCPLSQWCYPTISSSVAPFSSCPQSFPASGSFPKGLSRVFSRLTIQKQFSHPYMTIGKTIALTIRTFVGKLMSLLFNMPRFVIVFLPKSKPLLISWLQSLSTVILETKKIKSALNTYNPWMEEPGRLQSMGSLRVGHNWATSLSLFTFMHWRRKWQPTPVFLPGESQGQQSLVACRLWGHTESDTTEAT